MLIAAVSSTNSCITSWCLALSFSTSKVIWEISGIARANPNCSATAKAPMESTLSRRHCRRSDHPPAVAPPATPSTLPRAFCAPEIKAPAALRPVGGSRPMRAKSSFACRSCWSALSRMSASRSLVSGSRIFSRVLSTCRLNAPWAASTFPNQVSIRSIICSQVCPSSSTSIGPAFFALLSVIRAPSPLPRDPPQDARVAVGPDVALRDGMEAEVEHVEALPVGAEFDVDRSLQPAVARVGGGRPGHPVAHEDLGLAGVLQVEGDDVEPLVGVFFAHRVQRVVAAELGQEHLAAVAEPLRAVEADLPVARVRLVQVDRRPRERWWVLDQGQRRRSGYGPLLGQVLLVPHRKAISAVVGEAVPVGRLYRPVRLPRLVDAPDPPWVFSDGAAPLLLHAQVRHVQIAVVREGHAPGVAHAPGKQLRLRPVGLGAHDATVAPELALHDLALLGGHTIGLKGPRLGGVRVGGGGVVAPDVVPGELDVLAGDVVGVGVLGDVYGEAMGLDHAVQAHGALAEVHQAVGPEDWSSRLVPAALRELVHEDRTLARGQIVLDDACVMAALEANEDLVAPHVYPPRPAEALLREDLEVSRRIHPQDARRQPRAGRPRGAALQHEERAVVCGLHARGHREPHEDGLHLVPLGHPDVARVHYRARRRGQPSEGLLGSSGRPDGHLLLLVLLP